MMQLFYDDFKNIRSQPRWFSSAIIINQSVYEVFKLRCKLKQLMFKMIKQKILFLKIF